MLFFRKNFNLSLLYRLENFRKKLIKLSAKRFNSELFFQSFNLLKNNTLVHSKFINKKFWFYIFQLESVRSFQFYKLVVPNDLVYLIPESQIYTFYLVNSSFYQKYFFNSYIFKCNKTLEKVLVSFPFSVKDSFFSIDLKVNIFFVELKKKLFLYYCFFNLGKSNNLKSSLFPVKKECFKSSFLIGGNEISLLFPINYIFSRFREMGFLHPFTYRPVSNLKLLFLSDKSIIKFYGYFAYSLLLWYNISENFFQVKVLVEFLRQSCFLTLCRKHNKNKNWAFNIYTSNLLLLRGLFTFNSFFPSKKYLFRLKRGDFFSRKTFFLFDEEFFFNS